MKEIWKDIRGYTGLYQVSNLGRVRSLDRVKRNGNGTWINKGRVLKPGNIEGYRSVGLSVSGFCKTIRVHILVAKAFIINPKKLPQINHLDGNKANNKLSNLEWSTVSDNLKHAFRIGLKSQEGDKHHNRILSSKEVLLIRDEYKPFKITNSMLAKKYGVSKSTIKDIIKKRTWDHL